MVETGNRRRSKEQRAGRHNAEHDVAVENGALVQMGCVVLSNQRGAQAAVGKRLCDGHEERKHAQQPELLGHKQTGKDYPNDKLDALLPEAIQGIPENASDGSLSKACLGHSSSEEELKGT